MQTRVNLQRWLAACMDAGVASKESDYRALRRAWGGMGRHYHTLEHLNACLGWLDECRQLTQRPAEIEIALWFHDAIYRTWRKDNEERSAEWAATVMRGSDIDLVTRVCQMIRASTHREYDFGGDTAIMLDIDITILGARPDVFAQFERAIRREYWWVPRSRYVAGRTRVIESFLARPLIYQNDWFAKRYEEQARANLTAALEQLKWK